MVVVTSGKTKDGKPCEMYIDGLLKKSLDIAKERVIKRNWDYVCVISGIPGCLTGDTLIQTNYGNKSLNELSNRTIFVKSYDFKSDNIVKGKAYVFPTGEKEVYEIETKDGRKIQATEDHIFFVERNKKIVEVKLKEMKVKDKLICKS